MSNDSLPFVYLLKTNNHPYVYDVNTNQVVRVSEELFQYLKATNLNRDRIKTDSIIQEESSLKAKGYLNPYRPEHIYRPDTEDLDYYLNHRMSEMILQVTQSCNFACRYCKYSYDTSGLNHQHNNRFMTWEIAKKSIDFLAQHSRDSSFISIAFYGGEPLLNYPLIKKCIDYSQNIFFGKKQRYAITTNGSLLSFEMIEFFIRKNVSLTVSLDGPQKIHDKNRKNGKNGQGTFSIVFNILQQIKKKYPDYYRKIKINSVIDPLNSIKDIDDFFYQDLFQDNHVNTPLVKLSNSSKIVFPTDYLIEYNKDKLLALLALAGLCEITDISKIAASYYEQLLKFKKKLSKHNPLPPVIGVGGTCRLGALRAFTTIDGRIYPCEKINDNSHAMQIGTIETGFDIQHIKSLYNMLGLLDGKCNNCWNIRLCNICPMKIDTGLSLSKEQLAIECRNEKHNSASMLLSLIAVSELDYIN